MVQEATYLLSLCSLSMAWRPTESTSTPANSHEHATSVVRTGSPSSSGRQTCGSSRYDNATFDYVYEHFSLCHLDPAGTAQALSEMRRVLKPSGLAFFGVMSTEP